MADMPKFEIPDAVRDMAERNVEQVRGAYDQMLAMARQTQEALMRSAGAMGMGAFVDMQTRMFRYAQDNMTAGFDLAAELARARDLKDWVDIQGRFTQRQIKTYTDQAQELGRMMTEIAQKTKR